MCQNLDLRFFLFYYLFMLVFSFLFTPFHLFCVSVFLLSFPLFLFGFFIVLPFSPSFLLVFASVFRLMWVSSLAYSSFLGTKRFGCCCCKCHKNHYLTSSAETPTVHLCQGQELKHHEEYTRPRI
jgi:hypothetical protein